MARRKQILFLEGEDSRLDWVISQLKFNDLFLEISVLCSDLRYFDDSVNVRIDSTCLTVEDKLRWFENHSDQYDYVIYGMTTAKKNLLNQIVKEKKDKHQVIYGYAPVYFKNLNRKIIITDPLVNIYIDENKGKRIIDDLIKTIPKYYNKHQLVFSFVSYSNEKTEKNAILWDLVEACQKEHKDITFQDEPDQLDRLLNRKLGQYFHIPQLDVIVFPELTSANAVFKAFAFSEKDIKTGGVFLGGQDGPVHSLLSRSCAKENILNLLFEINFLKYEEE